MVLNTLTLICSPLFESIFQYSQEYIGKSLMFGQIFNRFSDLFVDSAGAPFSIGGSITFFHKLAATFLLNFSISIFTIFSWIQFVVLVGYSSLVWFPLRVFGFDVSVKALAQTLHLINLSMWIPHESPVLLSS